MRVLFVYPNNYLNIGIPTGIATLIAVLKQEGHKVKVFDFTFIKTRETSDDSLLVGNRIYLPTAYTIDDLIKDDPVESIEEKLEDILDSFQPELICLSAMTGTFDLGIDLLNKFKARLKCKVVVGGVHATIAPKDVLREDFVDFICVGEGEGFIVDCAIALSKGKDYRQIRNLGFKKQRGIRINKLRPFISLDDLPTPDWSEFDRRHLFRPFMGKVYQGSFYVMSRGCPYNCTYCANGALRKQTKSCGRYYRFQKPSTTIKHIFELKRRYNTTWFRFVDESLMSMTEGYLEELVEGLTPVGIQFGCSVRPETTTERKVSLLKQMGCVAMTVGVESGNEEIRRKVLNRKMTNEQIEKAISIIKDYGIRVTTFNMIGLPGETRDNVFETIRFNRKLSAESANVFIVYPFPGTEMSTKYKTRLRGEDGKIIPTSKASSFALSKMSPTKVEGLLRIFNLYLSLPEELWPIIRFAEENNDMGKVIFDALTKYSERLLQTKHLKEDTTKAINKT